MPSLLQDLLQGPISQTCPTAMLEIKRPDLRSRHDGAHDGNSNFLSRDVKNNDLIQTGPAHPLNDEFDVLVHRCMPIRCDIVEANGIATIVRCLCRRCLPG